MGTGALAIGAFKFVPLIVTVADGKLTFEVTLVAPEDSPMLNALVVVPSLDVPSPIMARPGRFSRLKVVPSLEHQHHRLCL